MSDRDEVLSDPPAMPLADRTSQSDGNYDCIRPFQGNGITIGYVDCIHGDDGRFASSKLTHHEVKVLAQHWIDEIAKIDSFWHFYRCTGSSEMRIRVYASMRLTALVTAGFLSNAALQSLDEEAAEHWGLNTTPPDLDEEFQASAEPNAEPWETRNKRRASAIRGKYSYKATDATVEYRLTCHEAAIIAKDWVCELGCIEAISYHGGGMNYRTVIDRYYIQGRLSNLVDSGLMSLTEVRLLIAEEERRRFIPPSHSQVPIERASTALREDGLIEWADID